MKALLEGRTTAARSAFEAYVKLDRNGVMETALARARLKQIDSDASHEGDFGFIRPFVTRKKSSTSE